MAQLNAEVAAETREVLSGLTDPVRMTAFSRTDCHLCGHVLELVDELAALSPRLLLEEKDFVADAAAAAAAGIERVPALTLARDGETRIPVRYYGLPSGHEFAALLRTLVTLSTGRGMRGVDAAGLAPLRSPVKLTVFVIAS